MKILLALHQNFWWSQFTFRNLWPGKFLFPLFQKKIWRTKTSRFLKDQTETIFILIKMGVEKWSIDLNQRKSDGWNKFMITVDHSFQLICGASMRKWFGWKVFHRKCKSLFVWLTICHLKTVRSRRFGAPPIYDSSN